MKAPDPSTLHPLNVKCPRPRCNRPGALFGTVHYIGPPCPRRSCEANMREDDRRGWICPACGHRERMDSDRAEARSS